MDKIKNKHNSNPSLVFVYGWGSRVPIVLSFLSVDQDVGLSCIQWRASNRQCILSVGVVWLRQQHAKIAGRRSRITLHIQRRSVLHPMESKQYSGQWCCDTPVRAVPARSAGKIRYFDTHPYQIDLGVHLT